MTDPGTPRLFYIPTNRECSRAIQAYAVEAAQLHATSTAHVVFAVIESDEGPHVKENLIAFREMQQRVPVDLIHFTVAEQVSFFDRLMKVTAPTTLERSYLQRLLLPQGIAYGAGPNKASLIATALRVSTMHRRDSDTVPMQFNGAPLYASELEARFVGKRLEEVKDVFQDHDQVTANSLIYFMGSDYQGDLPVDRQELIELSEDLLVDLERLDCPLSDRAEIEEFVNSYYLARNDPIYEGDKVELDLTGKTELGVSCIHLIFRELPEMPIKDTLGCDYFQKNLLYRLNSPVLYHNRRVDHRYTQDRDTRVNVDTFIDYNLRDARYKILWRVWSRHNRTLEARRKELLSTQGHLIDTGVYIDSFLGALKAISQDELTDIPLYMAKVFERAATLSAPESSGKYVRLARELFEKATRLVEDVTAGIRDYCFLIEYWPKLVVAAETIGASNLILTR